MTGMPVFCGDRIQVYAGLLAAYLTSCVSLAASDDPGRVWPEHYDVAVRIEPAAHRISGISTVHVRGSSPELRFLLNKDLKVTAVRAGTNALPFSFGAVEQEARTILVPCNIAGRAVSPKQPPDRVLPALDSVGASIPTGPGLEITIEYEGNIAPPGPNDPDWMGALVLRTNEIRMTEQTKWFPMLEGRRGPTYTRVILPANLVLISPVNARKSDGNSNTSTWEASCNKPAALALIAGAFEVKQQAGSPARVALFPDQADKAELISETAGQILSFFENKFGPAPFEGLTICQMRVLNPRFSYDFAAPGAVVLPSEIISMAAVPDHRAFWIRKLAHEIAHQWWGCSVDLPRDRWAIGESLAEFAAASYLESAEPTTGLVDLFEDEIQEIQLQSFLTRRGQPVDERTFRKTLAYRKGPVLLWMLRDIMGKHRFDAALRGLCERHAFGKAGMKDFLDAFGEDTAVPVNLFFEQWLERRVVPKVRVEVARDEPIALRVVQAEPLFSFPLEIQVATQAGRTCVTCRVSEAEHMVKTGVRGQVDWVKVDPDGKILLEARDGVAEVERYSIAAIVAYERVFENATHPKCNMPAIKRLRDIFRIFMTAWDAKKLRERRGREGKIDLKTEFELQQYERLREGLEQLAGGKDLGPLLREVEDAADDIGDGIRDGRTESVPENAERLKAGWARFCKLIPEAYSAPTRNQR